MTPVTAMKSLKKHPKNAVFRVSESARKGLFLLSFQQVLNLFPGFVFDLFLDFRGAGCRAGCVLRGTCCGCVLLAAKNALNEVFGLRTFHRLTNCLAGLFLGCTRDSLLDLFLLLLGNKAELRIVVCIPQGNGKWDN